ncbi:MAG: hypothetical protein NVS4B3_14500 [Gemmatimonadaceae bacterium]
MGMRAEVKGQGANAGKNDENDGLQERAGAALEKVRATTGNLQAGLADMLDAGAQAVRERGQVSAGQGRLGDSSEFVAIGFERAALWLRENDVSDLESMARRQIDQHPGRTTLLALGLGFLLSRPRR